MTTKLQPMTVLSIAAARSRVVAIASLLVVLVGCGGGGSDAPAPQAQSSSGGSVADAVVCVLGAVLVGGCPDSGSSGSSTGGSTGSSGSSTGGSVCDDPLGYSCVDPGLPYPIGGSSGTSGSSSCEPTEFSIFGFDPSALDCDWQPFAYPDEDAALAMTTSDYELDIEPNDDLSMAVVLPVYFSPYDTLKTSVATKGTLTAGTDVVDSYIFTASQGWQIDVQLCYERRHPCGQQTPESSIAIDVAQIELLDQFGTLIAKTANDTVNGNSVSIPIDGGLPYYVSVVGGDLANTQSYYLRITRRDLPAQDLPPGPAIPEAPTLYFYNDPNASSQSDLTATFYWDAPTLNSDGTPLLDLKGYVLYFGKSADGADPYQPPAYDHRQPIDLGLSSFMLTLPDNGRWWFTMTAVNADGIESEPSNGLILDYASSVSP